MNREYIAERVVEISKQKGIIKTNTNIDIDAPLLEVYGVSSINLVELIVLLEVEFDIEFDDAELNLANFKNLNSIIDIIVNKKACNNIAQDI